MVTGNPIIRHKFTSDPTASVYNNTVYLYTGHDEPVDTSVVPASADWVNSSGF